MSWPVMIIITIALLALVIFLIRRNQKDEKKFEKQLNADQSIPKEHDNDLEPDDELTK